MQRVDRIAQLGWFATAAVVALAIGGCAPAARPEPVSTTTTTGAITSRAHPIPLEDRLPAPLDPAACAPRDLMPVIDFTPRTAELQPGETKQLDRWEKCLDHPDQSHTTIVLVGDVETGAPASLYYQRAAVVRTALVMRGVDERRIVVGVPKTRREGGALLYPGGIRVEPTYQYTIRGFEPPPLGTGGALP
jgi:hypothetical protein